MMLPTKLTKKAIRKMINERMLLLMEYAINKGLAFHESDYLSKIDFPRTNITLIRSNRQGFTTEHILKACKLTGASVDFIFGFTNNRLRKKSQKPMELLREAVHAIDLELKNGR